MGHNKYDLSSLKCEDKKEDKNQHKREKKSHYCDDDCICSILDQFAKGKEINIMTKSGDIIHGEFVCVTEDGCVVILESAMITPHINEKVTFIRCKDIESFSLDVDKKRYNSS